MSRQSACPAHCHAIKLPAYIQPEAKDQPLMIDHPLPDIDAWVLLFSSNSLPVLRATKRRMEEMKERMDSVDSREVAQMVLHDPIMTVRVLAYIQPFRGRSLQHDITTIAGAVMMSGIEPFFRRFDNLPTIEEMLKGYDTHAMLGILQIIRRAQKAADLAQEWAIWRHDINMEEVRIAALLHDLAEILVWSFAPKLGLQIRALQQAHPNMRSADAQNSVLGVNFQEIQKELCKVWHLPSLLTHLIDDHNAHQARVKNVSLAVRLARHSANGWQDPALPDDYQEIAGMLNLTVDAVKKKLGVDT